ncbi:uncharacterized protein EI97DRAFT_434195 [Westerdykella ornata]|uniref:N-acetyltransferase domain-containing protein n=1 Tax=Westerdykella ornata TaxID=318751 RepID=A0A6A6JGE1_WESOR|nr:uncharacterized protein EI97DRAFT_434195 [Westerdykella ornata]KAF2275335.1 hypothetical protein EI97DRAFT_434195 [Westerdykella ornata]
MDGKSWQRSIGDQHFLISTSRSLLPISFVQSAFADPSVYWAEPLSDAATRKMLDNCCTLGLYTLPSPTDTSNPTPIGLARWVTDYVTFAYLTDVFILDAYRNLGLGKWMVRCCREWVLEEMPELRRVMLLTGDEHFARLYGRELGMRVVGRDEGSGLLVLEARKGEVRKAEEEAEKGNNDSTVSEN